MFKLSVILTLLFQISSAYSSDKIYSLSEHVFKNTKVESNQLILPTENFDKLIYGDVGVFKDIAAGGTSKSSSFFVTDVDDSRYGEQFEQLQKQLVGTTIDKSLLLNFSPFLELKNNYIVGKFSLGKYSIDGVIIAGKNKRNNNQYVYELYFQCNGDLYSLSYFTILSFEQIFT